MKYADRPKWDIRFLKLAQEVSTWSRDPSTKVGAVIVRPDKTIASVGFNGFARYHDDTPEEYDNRGIKYSKIIHAEMNAILHAREPLRGFSLYLYPFLCCDRCAVHVIQAGIVRVVAPEIPVHLRERWAEILDRSMSYFKEAAVDVTIQGLGK
jgi:dCMP deaminase